MLGVETPAPADVHNKEELTAVHHALLGAEIVIVEGLANLDALQQEEVTFIALPLKLAGVDGSPVRATTPKSTTSSHINGCVTWP